MINVRIPNKEVQKLSPKIAVLGVGGAGGNAVNNMITAGLQGCEFIVCNTDAQALEGSLCENKIQLGAAVTGGLGAGAKPEVGRAAAEESIDEVAVYLQGANMAFITAGMGGGTGTGAAPVIAKICRDLGVLTVGVVTKPFHFEGTHRMKMAEAGIAEMQQYVDTLIVIPNQNLFRVANEKTTFAEAFRMADSVLQSGVRGVTDLMVMPGLINLDFADVRSAMLEMGKAMMGTGEATGERRAIEAAEAAINNPLLDDVSMKGARGVIINVTGGLDMTLFEVDEACNRIRDEVDPNANIIFGSTFDEKLDGVMRVSVVATGIDAEAQRQNRPVTGKLINSMTGQLQQERKLERAQPNTQVRAEATAEKKPVEAAAGQRSDAAAVAAPSPYSPAAHIPAQGPVTASAMSYASALAATRRREEPESDMFEQRVYEAQPQGVALPEATAGETDIYVPAPAPQSAGALRGTIYNDAFIPPVPAEVEVTRSETGYGPALGPLTAKRPLQAEPPAQTVTSPGLTLKPPVPGASARKKTPSLFDRITGQLRPHAPREEDVRRDSYAARSDNPPPLQAPQREIQGSLNIDAPARGEAVEDELDIPAFLRRQAN